MAFPEKCPSCQKQTKIIKYGKLKLAKETPASVQRFKCLKCDVVFISQYRDNFFRGMRNDPVIIDQALLMHSDQHRITDISRELGIKPNIIVYWIKRVRDPKWKPKYVNHLKFGKGYSPEQVKSFFSGFSWYQKKKRRLRLITMNKSRSKKSSSSPSQTTSCL